MLYHNSIVQDIALTTGANHTIKFDVDVSNIGAEWLMCGVEEIEFRYGWPPAAENFAFWPGNIEVTASPDLPDAIRLTVHLRAEHVQAIPAGDGASYALTLVHAEGARETIARGRLGRNAPKASA
ncbi:hypothetical protein [Salinarimonas chemoclinalis]|uniref:hypothetical protein n=1 Tax=Salinarimonas chemoclinalis TaxID=3241599 RepID=UPI003557E719